MKDEQRYYREITTKNGQICSMEIKLFRESILTISQIFIDGQHNVVIVSSNEELQALKKMLEKIK